MKSISLIFIFTIVFAFIRPLCIFEPDKEFIYSDTTMVTDTALIYDTTFINDTTMVYDTTYVHDTTILFKDTLYDTTLIYDTTFINDTTMVYDTTYVHDTTYIHDTTTVYDTLKTFATNTISDSLLGSWTGIVAGKTVTITFSTSAPYVFVYTANIGSDSYEGTVDSYENNIAHCIYMHGPGMGSETANWLISISNNVLTLQQTGYPMFPTMQAFTLNRIL